MMQFRINTRYESVVSMEGLPYPMFLMVAEQVCIQLGWEVSYRSYSGLILTTSKHPRHEEITIRLLSEQMANIKSASSDGNIHDWGKNKKNTLVFIEAFQALRKQISYEWEISFMENYMAQPQQGPDKLHPFLYREQEAQRHILSQFIPRQGYLATPLIIIANILVFLAMVLSGVHPVDPDTGDIFRWGGNFAPAILKGDWWRLITCCFLHIGVVHLLGNMLTLTYIGMFLEPLLGTARYITAYLFTGITGSLLSMYLHPATLSAGASGAIFGMFGVFIALLTTRIVDKTAQRTILPAMAFFVIFSLLNGLKPGIDNAGHVGGLLGGLAIGYLYSLFPKSFGNV